MQRISDNGDLEPLPFDNDPELVKWARYGVDQLKRENAERNAQDEAEREVIRRQRGNA